MPAILEQIIYKNLVNTYAVLDHIGCHETLFLVKKELHEKD
jgi:hypothetical protein